MNILRGALCALSAATALLAMPAAAATVVYDFEGASAGDVISGWQPGTDYPAFNVSGVVASDIGGVSGNSLKLDKVGASPSPWTNSFIRLGFTHVQEGLEYWSSLTTISVYTTSATTFYWGEKFSQVIPDGTWTTINVNWPGNTSMSFRSLGDVYIDNASIVSTYSATPEPGTWALLITGFGMAGAALRRRRSYGPQAV